MFVPTVGEARFFLTDAVTPINVHIGGRLLICSSYTDLELAKRALDHFRRGVEFGQHADIAQAVDDKRPFMAVRIKRATNKGAKPEVHEAMLICYGGEVITLLGTYATRVEAEAASEGQATPVLEAAVVGDN